MLQDEGDWHSALSAREWKAIEAAGMLAARGRHSEAEATRYAAGYHAGQDDLMEPPIAV